MFCSLKQSMKKAFRAHEFYLLLVIIFLIVLLAIVSGGKFIAIDNLVDMFAGNAALGVMAVGFLVVLISGGIDMSFMAVASIAQYLVAKFMLSVGGNMILVFILAGLIGIALGLINALLVHFLKAPTIIITIATMNVFYGLLIYVSNGVWLYDFPGWFKKTPLSTILLPICVLLFAILLTWSMLRYTKTGRKIFAVGGNLEAAKRIGINVLNIRIVIYAYMGLMAALGSVVQAYIIQNVAPNSLIGREMEVLAMVVLGGATLTGGKGTVLGTVLGLFLVIMIGNGLVLIGVSSYYHDLVMGIVVLISFCISGLRSGRKKEKEVVDDAK